MYLLLVQVQEVRSKYSEQLEQQRAEKNKIGLFWIVLGIGYIFLCIVLCFLNVIYLKIA